MQEQTLIHDYQAYLERIGKSSHTVKAYTQDLTGFARWYEHTTGEVLSPQAVDPREIAEYRGYLIRTGAKPATVNRKLIAL